MTKIEKNPKKAQKLRRPSTKKKSLARKTTIAKRHKRVGEYVGNLVELHQLQGQILSELQKAI